MTQSFTKKLVQTFVSIFLALVICSCSSDNQDLLDTFEKVKARKGRPIEKIPEPKTVPKFTYPSHLKRRDPFFKYIKPSAHLARKNKPDVNAPNLKRPKQALELFKLKDLRMVGMLKRNGRTWGLISTPDGIVMKVTLGDYLGKNYGQVKSITSRGIRIVEKVKKKDRWQKRPVNMPLDTVDKTIVQSKSIKFDEIVR